MASISRLICHREIGPYHIFLRVCLQNKMDDNHDYSEELELLGPIIMPEFELKSELMDEVELEKTSQSDEDLVEAVESIKNRRVRHQLVE